MKPVGFVFGQDVFCPGCARGLEEEAWPLFSFSEADHPLHCDQCGSLVPVMMTDAGVYYIVDAVRSDRMRGSAVSAEWVRAYFPGRESLAARLEKRAIA